MSCQSGICDVPGQRTIWVDELNSGFFCPLKLSTNSATSVALHGFAELVSAGHGAVSTRSGQQLRLRGDASRRAGGPCRWVLLAAYSVPQIYILEGGGGCWLSGAE